MCWFPLLLLKMDWISLVSILSSLTELISSVWLNTAPTGGSLGDSYTNNGARTFNFSWGSNNNTYGTNPIDIDNFDATMKRMRPTACLPAGAPGDDEQDVWVEFTALDDFHPDALFERLPIFRYLKGLRHKLDHPGAEAEVLAELQRYLGEVYRIELATTTNRRALFHLEPHSGRRREAR